MLLRKKDFKFKKYSDDGDSGHLYLAERNSDGKRFIVKHAFSDCACNEFLYFSIAKELGVKIQEFYLFEKDESRNHFNSGYAIGIEYIDSIEFKGVTEHSGIINQRDYFRHKALFTAFLEQDGMEIIVGKDKYFYRIDTTDAFALNYGFINAIHNPEIQRHFYDRALEHDDTIYRNLLVYGKWVQEEFAESGYEPFVEVIEDLAGFSLERWEAILDELCLLFPKELRQYYLNFFESCKKACKRYLLL